MTDDAFEAFWFLYQACRRSLAKMAMSSSTYTSTLTYFHQAVKGALNRSNDVDTFINAIEAATDLNFTQHYDDPLPTAEAMAALFAELKQHSTLAFMPRLVERVQERKLPTDDKEEMEEEA
jgi:cysteinyl-tRNA synthetase